jgi:SNF2 family DNA or RNA helicase
MSLHDLNRHVVDVRVSESFDALFATPRDHQSGSEVYSAIRRSLGSRVPLRRSADGVRVPADCAMALVDTPGLDLRWSGDAQRFCDNRRHVAHHFPEQFRVVQEIKARGADYARKLIMDSAGLEILDPHQIVNVAAMTTAGGFGVCVFDEQGAGKTVTMIYSFDLLVARDEVDLMVIIAPKSMVPEWPADFRRFRGDLYRVAVISGSPREKRRALESGADVFVTNFETAVSLEPEFRALLRTKNRRGLLVVDESFFIKSLDAKRTRALRRLREWCGRAFVLCGTPAPNAPVDLVQQFSLVDFGYTFENVATPKDRQAAQPVVQNAIETRGLYVRHLKADVLPELPEKRFQRLYVPLEPAQRRAYEGALRDLIVDLESISDQEFQRRIPNFLARRAALLQICSNPAGLVPGYRETPAKLHALDALFQELILRQREKVVLWSFYTASIDGIMARYGPYGAVRYDGTITEVAARRDAVRRFQEDDQTMLFVGNPAAAGAGLTLHRARFGVYESFSNQAAHYLQSLDRIHRRGQTRQVDYIVLLGEGTIELSEYDRLIAKETASQQLLGDPAVSPLTREILLADARAAASLWTVAKD